MTSDLAGDSADRIYGDGNDDPAAAPDKKQGNDFVSDFFACVFIDLYGNELGDFADESPQVLIEDGLLNGFEVKDLGVDVPANTIIQEAKEFGADIVGLSGLLTLAFDPMKEVVSKMQAEGLGDKKVVIGGAQMDEHVCTYVGADAWVIDAVAGINYCKQWMS